MNIKSLAYCKLNLDFDRELFSTEYDQYILPSSQPITNGVKSWEMTRSVNQCWGMVDPETYDKCNIQDPITKKIISRGIEQWQADSLIELETDNPELLALSKIGSVAVRNNLLENGTYKFKDQYLNLNISKWINQLPLTKIIGVRCVSLKPGSFASIHRDENNLQHHKNGTSLPTNLLWEAGFVSITINITDGGQPLYYSLNADINTAFKINDPVYLFNDFCPHGVPVVNSRRRQIRVTGIPNEDFYKLIDNSTAHYIQ